MARRARWMPLPEKGSNSSAIEVTGGDPRYVSGRVRTQSRPTWEATETMVGIASTVTIILRRLR
jgi:hypothetical protein